MIERRSFDGLGGADHGWLKAKHHFSFAGYYDPKRMGVGALRVWNDDEIAPNTGFPAHPHSDMEIITYVREGAITHKDSFGNEGRTKAGDVQVMSAGTGIRHSEYNLEAAPTKIFQIWIEPRGRGGAPSWGAKPFPKSDRDGRLVALASGFADDCRRPADPRRCAGVGRDPQDRARSSNIRSGPSATAILYRRRDQSRSMASRVDARDGAAIRREAVLKIAALEDSEIVLVDAA